MGSATPGRRCASCGRRARELRIDGDAEAPPRPPPRRPGSLKATPPSAGPGGQRGRGQAEVRPRGQPWNSVDRPWRYAMPPLQEARDAFLGAMNIEPDGHAWPKVEGEDE